MSDTVPAPRPTCRACSGGGYVVQAPGVLAEARLCACVSRCTRCDGDGHLVREGRMGRCRCRMLPDRIELFNRAGLPARHARSSFATFQPHPGAIESLAAAQRWTQGGPPRRGLVLWGAVGRGKTHLLIALLRALIFEQGLAVQFVEFSALLAHLKEGFERGEGQEGRLAELARAPLLAVDELGKGRLTDWEQSIADDLVARRYNSGRPLLGTTNYRPGPASPGANRRGDDLARQTLGDRVGDRSFSRLAEMVDFVEAGGADYRRRVA